MGSVNNGGEKQAVHSSNDNATRRVPERLLERGICLCRFLYLYVRTIYRFSHCIRNEF